MDILDIDVETYSSIDITTSGAYKYVEAPDFKILLFGYAFNDEEVQVVDLAQGEDLPEKVIQALSDPNVIKTAFNANFERNAIRSYLNIDTPPEMWQCTMVKALTLGLPGSLDMVSKVMGFPEDKQKMKEGKALIQYFCKPYIQKKKDERQITFLKSHQGRHLPKDDPEKWDLFKKYNKQDVEVEREIRELLSGYKTTDKEQRLWELDQHINDRGVNTDLKLIEQAIKCDANYTKKLMDAAIKLTGLENPNSPTQIKKWIGARLGHEVKSLNKASIPKLIEEAQSIKNSEVIQMLKLRQLMAKTSIKKYETMQNARCKDGKVRGLLQFYGANRTGRWAGRLVQVQNLPQNHLPDLDNARTLIKNGKFDDAEFLYDSIPDTLSQLIRTAFIPNDGNRFIVADFSAIEARVIAWYAGEQWRLKVFKTHGKIYEASAAQMFHVPIESIHKGDPLRQKGKIAELALGYGGSIGALTAMGALKMGVKQEELPELVNNWRDTNPHITKFWWDVDKAAKKAIKEKTVVTLQYGLKFIYDPKTLFVQLPSGRKLSYIEPEIKEDKYGSDAITYMGLEQTSKQWVRIETYGPKLVENIVQATARDCLGETMQRVSKAGYDIVMHVHDEIIMDVPKDYGSLKEVIGIFAEPIDWAPGLPLKADGYECNYYMKD